MSDPSGERADRFKFPGLLEFTFHPVFFGDILVYSQDAVWFVVFIHQRHFRCVDPQPFAVGLL